jgi:cell division protein FtsZ
LKYSQLTYIIDKAKNSERRKYNMGSELNTKETIVRIKVLGAGGGGSNAVNRMIEDEIQNVDFIVVDTNAISAAKSKAQNIIQIGENEAKGIGAGANPEVGENSAKENAEEIAASLVNTDLLFLTAGMGGGTGTGALPVIAEMAKEMGILTIGIVTKPFKFEGKMREKKAMTGIEKLKQNVDALIVIENDKLLKINSDNVTIVDAFKQADNTLKQGIVGITDLLNTVGEINIDFADISTIISIRGLAYMGIGSAIGENALAAATRKAIDNPLTAVNINGAKGIIINIQGSKDLSLSEINSSVAIINDIVDEDANIIFGTVINEDLGDEVIVTVIATGVDEVY